MSTLALDEDKDETLLQEDRDDATESQKAMVYDENRQECV